MIMKRPLLAAIYTCAMAFVFFGFDSASQDVPEDVDEGMANNLISHPADGRNHMIIERDKYQIIPLDGDMKKVAKLNTPTRRAHRHAAILAIEDPAEYERHHHQTGEQLEAQESARIAIQNPGVPPPGRTPEEIASDEEAYQEIIKPLNP
jgi:hypothetical protein